MQLLGSLHQLSRPSVAATVLTVLLNLPGRKVLQRLLPLALGGGVLYVTTPRCSARADSVSTGNVANSKPVTQNAAAQPARLEQPGAAATSLPELMSKLLGDNQFANVRDECHDHVTCSLSGPLYLHCAGAIALMVSGCRISMLTETD